MKKHHWYIIPSIILAVGLWFFVMSRVQAGVSLEVPLQYKGLQKGLRVNGRLNKSVTVTVKGHERFLSGLNPEDVRVVLDLSNVKKGGYQHRIREAEVQLPPTLKLISIDPPSVHVDVEETARKTVPVQPAVIGLAPRGYYVGGVDVIPPDIEVEGLKSDIRKLSHLSTEHIDVSTAKESFSEEVKVDFNGMDLTSEVLSVTVKITIRKGIR